MWEDDERLVNQYTSELGQLNDLTLSEMSIYLLSAVVPLALNPLEWWRTHKGTYPKLENVANNYLTSVSTSVPAERLFSKAGLTITQQRNRLKGKRLSQILFLQSIDKSLWHLS